MAPGCGAPPFEALALNQCVYKKANANSRYDERCDREQAVMCHEGETENNDGTPQRDVHDR